MSNIIDSIRLSGVTYTLSAETSGGNNVVELTQAQYDALVDKDPTAFYIITDATAGDLTQYWTSAQTQSAITSAVSTKQDTLVSGTNIKTVNNESLLGSGNIVIQGGGGTTYSAGTGIDITDNVISASFIIENYGGDNYKGLVFTSNGSGFADVSIPLYGGIVSDNYDGRLSTKMQSTPYQWLSADTSESYESSKFSMPSSAITFDMSRNPSEMLRWCSNGSCYGLIDSNGDNADPDSFSVVNDNGHITVIAIGRSLIEQISDNSGELDQYVSNLQYWGCEYDTIPNVVNTKQATLVSGTNIKTINNESILGSGNIDIQGGGGKAIEAGRGITVTSGETADTISFSLPISAGTGSYSIAEGHTTNKASGSYSHAEGKGTIASGAWGSHAEGSSTTASGSYSHAEGSSTIASGNYSHAEGYYTIASGQSEHASGQYNVSNKANNTWGDSGNTLFSVGNGTADNARHNAFEIRQNGDIYFNDGASDVKLQDKFSTIETTIGDINTILQSI